MIYCPYCGIRINEDEVFCFHCGEKIPDDIGSRITIDRKSFNRLWILPITLCLLVALFIFGYQKNIHRKIDEAKQLYQQSEEKILDKEYHEAKKLLENVLQLSDNFPQAEVAWQFANEATYIQKNIEQAKEKLNDSDYEEALSLINESERSLRDYSGEAVNHLIDHLTMEQNAIKLESIKSTLEDDPSIDDLKVLLWEAEAIKIDDAEEITEHIREQIVDYTYSKAIEQLNKYQFSDAKILLDDGLKYAENSEKLKSLKATIEKEKEAFETAQQERIEQALYQAEEEKEMNEMEAITLKDANVTQDKNHLIHVQGEVESVATVPVHSVIIEYTLLDQDDQEILTNKAVTYPDTLYPEEIGKFEFTHFEIDEQIDDITIDVSKFTWYTE